MNRIERLSESVTLYLGDCREILPALGKVDHIITDPPYSARTHAGHDSSSAGSQRDGHTRQSLGYEPLSPVACARLAGFFNAATPGWIVWMTDDVLAPAIQIALAERGRKVFAPLPFFQPGRSVRLSGDGPCSWTDWIICSRTSTLKKWGTLPGGYVAGEGWSDKERMGGKPTRLMSLLVQHYSRADEIVCDPFMGGGHDRRCLRHGAPRLRRHRDRFADIRSRVPTHRARTAKAPFRSAGATYASPGGT